MTTLRSKKLAKQQSIIDKEKNKKQAKTPALPEEFKKRRLKYEGITRMQEENPGCQFCPYIRGMSQQFGKIEGLCAIIKDDSNKYHMGKCIGQPFQKPNPKNYAEYPCGIVKIFYLQEKTMTADQYVVALNLNHLEELMPVSAEIYHIGRTVKKDTYTDKKTQPIRQ